MNITYKSQKLDQSIRATAVAAFVQHGIQLFSRSSRGHDTKRKFTYAKEFLSVKICPRGIRAVSQFLKVLCLRKGASESSRPVHAPVGHFSFSALRQKQTLSSPVALNAFQPVTQAAHQPYFLK